MNESPFSSRKYVVTLISISIIILFPIAYKLLGLSDNITLLVGGSITTLITAYHGANVLSKKYTCDNKQGDDQGD